MTAATPTWPEVLSALLARRDLTEAEAAWAMRQIMSGEATDAQIAAFAVALRAKGESAEEVSGLSSVMLAFAAPVPPIGEALDIVGSGGDRAHTVNISTMAAIVAAATGVVVAKHGNRAASSACGSADLLEALGVAIDLDGAGVARCIERAGIGFCFAPVFHPSLRYAAVARREIGIPTVFNFLGPLTNPARPTASAVGVADPRMAPVVAGVLARRGMRALVFRGDDGLDELTVTTTSTVWVVRDGSVQEVAFDPRAVGIAPSDTAALRGADARHNAAVARAVLSGEPGPIRDAVLLNAAAGLVAFDTPRPDQLVDQISAAMTRCAAAIDSGKAAELLDAWVEASQAARGVDADRS
jgi:anthranilate phosphoribosyltransferase